VNHNDFQGRIGNRLLFLLLLPGLIAAISAGIGRYRAEALNHAVELTLDYDEVQTLSASSGKSVPELLSRFKTAGATGVAVTETTMGDLAGIGQVSYRQEAPPDGPVTEIVAADGVLASRIAEALRARLSPDLIQADGSQSPGRLRVRVSPTTLNGIGIGLPSDAVGTVHAAGLDVVARLQNNPAVTKRAIDAVMEELRRQGIRRLIFSGEEVLGFRGLVPYAAKSLTSHGLTYGSIEFGKQKGDARISKGLDSSFVRVHSISAAELATMAPSSAIERFTRAVKERGIRLCYVRLPETCGEDPAKDGASFVYAIRRDVNAAGYPLGNARPYQNIPRSSVCLGLIGLSVAAGGVLLLGSMLTLSSAARYGLLAVGAVGTAGLAISSEMGRQLTALSAALIFPTLGIAALIGPHFGCQNGKASVGRILALFLGTSAFSLYGAAMVVGLLADRSYMVKVNQFAGIKAAHLLPMLAIVLVMAAGLPIFGKPFSQVRKDVSANIRRLMANPLFVWHAIAVVFVLGIVGIALLRTGNDPGVGVSGIELKFRAILDRIMVVRPRTKEFLIGHPALLLGIGLLLTRRRTWGLPLVAFGALGQVSLLNTFCHIHSPLLMSIIRAANGLVLGSIIGLLIWILVVRPRLGSANPSGEV
jgi:hypothetical protein